MGTVSTIRSDLFPRQGTWLHRRAKVCFAYDTSKFVEGTVVRDDIEEPWQTIIRLDDGRYVRACECQFSTTPQQ